MQDRRSLTDIRSVKMPNNQSRAKNAQHFFERIRNPYLFKVEDIVVHVEFGDSSAESLQTHIQNLLISLQR